MNEQQQRWGILYCPKKGFANQRKRWAKIEEYLNKNDIVFDFIQSENSNSVERLVKMMINNGYKTIVIVGGDSALNDAVNSLMQTETSVREDVVLGVIPNGIMNDFARFWQLRENDIEYAIETLKKRRVRKIDLGKIKYKNPKGEPCHRYFLNCVNSGLVAAIMNLRRQTRKMLGSRMLSFIFSFILLLFQRLEYRMHLKINAEEVKRKVMTVCIGNAQGYGQTPNAVPYNGLLDVSVVYHPEVMQLIEGIYLFARGKFLNHRNVYPFRAVEVKVVEAQKALVGIDGRLMANPPKGEFTISVEQEIINFIIPG